MVAYQNFLNSSFVLDSSVLDTETLVPGILIKRLCKTSLAVFMTNKITAL